MGVGGLSMSKLGATSPASCTPGPTGGAQMGQWGIFPVPLKPPAHHLHMPGRTMWEGHVAGKCAAGGWHRQGSQAGSLKRSIRRIALWPPTATNSLVLLLLFFFFFFFFFELHLHYMEVPRLGVKLELQIPATTTAM